MEFDLPVRIHWQPGHPVSPDLVASIREGRPLEMTLEIEGIGQLAPLDLPWGGVSLVVVYHGWRGADPGDLPGIAARWEFPVDGPGDARSLARASFLGLPPARAAIRWYPRRGTLQDLVPLLEVAAQSGCGVTLPNRPADVIKSEGLNAFPEAGEWTPDIHSGLRALKDRLRSDQIRAHDFILTEALGLGGPEPQGCEAANSMAYIDPEGGIYPCQTLMIPMGDLNLEKPDAVWASETRQRIRREVVAVPGPCSLCSCLGRCRGGCRGTVYHLTGCFEAPDPQCPSRVEDHDA